MPSREDIVDLLYQCGKDLIVLGFFEKALIYREAAAQVALHGCETCNKKITAKPFEHRSGSFLVEHCPWQGCGGCFQHEPKGD